MDPQNAQISKAKKISIWQHLGHKTWYILGGIFISIAVILYLRRNKTGEQTSIKTWGNGVCGTKECEILGLRMNMLMNSSVNPCDDFYESICGNYPEKEKWSEVWNHLADDIRSFAEYFKAFQPVYKSEKVAKYFMEKCMDTSETRNRFDIYFAESLGGRTLTDYLIAGSKVNPTNNGFLKTDVQMERVNGEMRLTLSISNGIDMNSTLGNTVREILKENRWMKQVKWVTLSQLYEFDFIDLPRFAQGLVPEANRNENFQTNYYVEIYSLHVLKKVVETVELDDIFEIIRDKYMLTVASHLVTPDFESCFDKTNEFFPGTLGFIFVRQFVGKENIERADHLLPQMQFVFREMIDENDWLDQNLKDILKQEVNEMTTSIGIPDEHRKQEYIDKMYSRIGEDWEDQSYLHLVRNLLTMNSEETFLRVARKEKMTFLGQTIGFNANYHEGTHRTSFAPILLNFPYIDKNLPEWNTIASIGFIFAHEMGHAFDAKNFFKNPLRQKIEMSYEMEEKFKERVRCVIQKYTKYQFPDGTHSHGGMTQQEDSADMIGFNLAYRLFKKLGTMPKLPYLTNYTVEQQYFHRLGYLWCEGAMDENAIKLARIDTHSALKFRVNGMMSNSEEFAKAFNCPKNSPMNPEKKCPLFK